MQNHETLIGKAIASSLMGVAIALLSGCTQYINSDAVEAKISNTFMERTGLVLDSVICPEKEQKKKGRTFECEGTLEGGQVFNLTVTQLDHQEMISWDATSSLQSLKGIIDNDRLAAQITAGIKTQTKIEVVTDCGELFRIARKGEVFNCTTIDQNNNQTNVMVKAQDDEGNVSWEI